MFALRGQVPQLTYSYGAKYGPALGFDYLDDQDIIMSETEILGAVGLKLIVEEGVHYEIELQFAAVKVSIWLDG